MMTLSLCYYINMFALKFPLTRYTNQARILHMFITCIKLFLIVVSKSHFQVYLNEGDHITFIFSKQYKIHT